MHPAHLAVGHFNAELQFHEVAVLHCIDIQPAAAFDILRMHHGFERIDRPCPLGSAHADEVEEFLGNVQLAAGHVKLPRSSRAASAASLLRRFASNNWV
jgi:hypothetical protein